MDDVFLIEVVSDSAGRLLGERQRILREDYRDIVSIIKSQRNDSNKDTGLTRLNLTQQHAGSFAGGLALLIEKLPHCPLYRGMVYLRILRRSMGNITGIDRSGGIHKGNMELLKAGPRSSKSGREQALGKIHP